MLPKILRFNKSILYTNYKKMWKFIKPYKWLAIISLCLSVPIGALEASIAYLLKPFMDTVLIEKSISTTYIPIIIIGVTIFQSILMFTSSIMNSFVGEKISISIKEKMFSKLLSKESSFFDNTTSGDVIFNFNTNVDNACSGLLENIKILSVRLCTSIALIVVLFLNSWKLAIVALISIFIAMIPLTKVRNKIKNAMDSVFASMGILITFFNEVFNGNKVINTYNIQGQLKKDFSSNLSKFFKLKMKIVRRTSILSPIMNIIVTTGLAIIIWYGASLIEQGELTPGALVSFLVSLMMLYAPIKKMGNMYGQIQLSLIAMEKMFECLEEKPIIQDNKDAKELLNISKGIFFKNVDFHYNNNIPVLKNINLNIQFGKVYAFVGNSGGGKTTLSNLIPRFYDIQSGDIYIDDLNIKDIKLKSLRKNISIVFQNNFLFNGSLRKNLLVGNPNATEEELNKAIKESCLKDFVESLPNKLDTEVGEMGVLLSGGQKQRIAIARAFLKNAPIIILDEATSALDNKSELVVQEAINNLIKNRTVIIIAHRLSTIKNADKIIVINNGEIVEQGSHSELISKKEGVYNSLYRSHSFDNSTNA